MASSHEHLSLLAEVAVLYYDKQMTQAEIAAVLDVSRSTVSRLLDEAVREKVVEITIHFPWRSSIELSARLEERFHLRVASVLTDLPVAEDRVTAGMGALAALYLSGVMREDSTIAVAWGQAVYQTVKALRVTPSSRRHIVQAVGVGSADNSVSDAAGLVRLLTDAAGGTPHYLYAPRLVEDETVRDALMHDASIQATLRLAYEAAIILTTVRGTGPGLDTPDPSAFYNGGVAPLQAGQPVGEMCGRPFDLHGTPVDDALNKRVIGIDLPALRANGQVLAIAGGQRHILALLGALRGGYINVLVTEESAARRLLELDRKLGCH